MERVSGEKTAEGATPMLTGPRGEEGDLGWKPLKAITLQTSQMWKIRDINLHLQKAEKT